MKLPSLCIIFISWPCFMQHFFHLEMCKKWQKMPLGPVERTGNMEKVINLLAVPSVSVIFKNYIIAKFFVITEEISQKVY